MNKNKNIKRVKNHKYHNMTDEEKQKYKDYQKEYRKNMTDEQKQKYKDYVVKKLNNKNIKKDNDNDDNNDNNNDKIIKRFMIIIKSL